MDPEEVTARINEIDELIVHLITRHGFTKKDVRDLDNMKATHDADHAEDSPYMNPHVHGT